MEEFPFEKFIQIGWEAHSKLAPSGRETPLTPTQIAAQNPRKAAVLCLWYPKEGKWHFPLIERTEYEGVHSKQISFPGGKKEPEDASLLITALRETKEELGIALPTSLNTFPLTELYIPPSNFWVQPYMAQISHGILFQKDPLEVEKIVEISLEELRQVEVQYTQSGGRNIPYFTLQGQKVWGATAMILNEIKEIIYLSL